MKEGILLVGIPSVGILVAGSRQVVGSLKVGSLKVGSLVGVRHRRQLVRVSHSSRPAVDMHLVVAVHILPLEVEGPCLWTFCGSALLLLAVSSHSAQPHPCASNQMP